MTNKDRLSTLLNGGVPDIPPHFEIDFHLWRELFGIHPKTVEERGYASERARQEALAEAWLEMQCRLVEDLGYASAFFHYQLPMDLGITRIKEAIGSRALLRTHEWDGVFWMPDGAGLMDFVVMMYERPDEMHARAREKCDRAKALLTRQFDVGADFTILCYDFGFNTGPFISPSQFAEFVKPYLTEIVQHVHDLGKKALVHSDGDINLLLDHLHDTGADGLHSIDPQGSMDIRAVRARCPDWLLMGNVHCAMLQDGVEPRIRESVRYCMEHGGVGKRYIFSTSNCVFPGMPPESYRIMLDEYNRLCRPARTGVVFPQGTTCPEVT
jgi:uroporphyrinogen decarboxylase